MGKGIDAYKPKPIKPGIIPSPVAADSVKIPAELFSYSEKIMPWEENV